MANDISQSRINNEVNSSSSSASEHVELGGFTQPGVSSIRLQLRVQFENEGNLVSLAGEDSPSIVSQSARSWLESHESIEQTTQALQILDLIDELLIGYSDLAVPEIQIAQADDNSIGLAWNVGNALLGISIEPDINESHWFLLVGDQDRAVRAYGYLNELDSDLLIEWLVSILKKIQHRQPQNND